MIALMKKYWNTTEPNDKPTPARTIVMLLNREDMVNQTVENRMNWMTTTIKRKRRFPLKGEFDFSANTHRP